MQEGVEPECSHAFLSLVARPPAASGRCLSDMRWDIWACLARTKHATDREWLGDWTPPAGQGMLGQRDGKPRAVSRMVTSFKHTYVLRALLAQHGRYAGHVSYEAT